MGGFFFFIPCTWGLAAGYPFFDIVMLKKFLLFLNWSILMRSFGCIINDYWDKDLDRLVERTKSRPLACGEISVKNAMMLMSVTLSMGLLVSFQLPVKSFMGVLTILPVIVIYPLMKRVTNFPQLILGICFNSGVLIAYPSIIVGLSITDVLPLYVAGILWTMIYDTFYAAMDKNDDIKIGIKSTAVRFGDKTKHAAFLFLCLGTGLISFYTYKILKKLKNGKKNIYAWMSYLFILISFLFQTRLIKVTNISKCSDCLKCFKLNIIYGALITLSIISSSRAIRT